MERLYTATMYRVMKEWSVKVLNVGLLSSPYLDHKTWTLHQKVPCVKDRYHIVIKTVESIRIQVTVYLIGTITKLCMVNYSAHTVSVLSGLFSCALVHKPQDAQSMSRTRHQTAPHQPSSAWIPDYSHWSEGQHRERTAERIGLGKRWPKYHTLQLCIL